MNLVRQLTLFAGLLLIVGGSNAYGAPPVRVDIEAFANAENASAARRCVVSQEFAKGGRVEMWVEIGQREDGRGDPTAAPAEIRCGMGKTRALETAARDSAQQPYLAADVSMFVWPNGQLGIRAFDIEISISGRKFSTPGLPFSEKRKLFFNEGGSVFLPLLLADESERSQLGLVEALIRAEARPVQLEQGAAYGTLLVRSDTAEAALFLDGGAVGVSAAGRESTLNNVRVGDREVSARDAKGRVVRKWVRVQRSRRTPVALNFETGSAIARPGHLEPTGKNAQGFDELRRSQDGALVIRIPAGEFLMGNRKTEREPFEHRVELSEYLIDKNEVTWEQFLKFAEATETPLPPHEPYWGIHADHPAVFVTWDEAKAYCEWTGARLPTEAEWEKAARGTDDRMYPWGNEEPDPDKGVFRRSWGLIATDPIGAHPLGASPYGLMDTGGNVWEWCSDWYDGGYYQVSPRKDPKGPASGQARVVRSGSWDSRPAVLSASCRNWGPRGYREGDFGFRCAMDPPK